MVIITHKNGKESNRPNVTNDISQKVGILHGKTYATEDMAKRVIHAFCSKEPWLEKDYTISEIVAEKDNGKTPFIVILTNDNLQKNTATYVVHDSAFYETITGELKESKILACKKASYDLNEEIGVFAYAFLPLPEDFYDIHKISRFYEEGNISLQYANTAEDAIEQAVRINNKVYQSLLDCYCEQEPIELNYKIGKYDVYD